MMPYNATAKQHSPILFGEPFLLQPRRRRPLLLSDPKPFFRCSNPNRIPSRLIAFSAPTAAARPGHGVGERGEGPAAAGEEAPPPPAGVPLQLARSLVANTWGARRRRLGVPLGLLPLHETPTGPPPPRPPPPVSRWKRSGRQSRTLPHRHRFYLSRWWLSAAGEAADAPISVAILAAAESFHGLLVRGGRLGPDTHAQEEKPGREAGTKTERDIRTAVPPAQYRRDKRQTKREHIVYLANALIKHPANKTMKPLKGRIVGIKPARCRADVWRWLRTPYLFFSIG